jgi:DNA-binding LacI/PurR family transcriptional regulator
MYFAQHLVGIEKACRLRGYGVSVSLYNLSNIDSFVFPPKVGERSVDGLFLTGYVQADVVERFKEFGIPCVCIGDNLEVAELIPTIACDIVGGFHQAIVHAASRGHHRIGFCEEPDRRGREVAQLLSQRVAADPATAHCDFRIIQLPQARNDYSDARPLADWLMGQPALERPTALLATDQTLVALLGELSRRGLRCPQDISLISNCDTVLCELCVPQLTAVNQNIEALGVTAAELLLNHLEHGAKLDKNVSRSDFACKLVVRDSCSGVV